jgi:hypothetical protein
MYKPQFGTNPKPPVNRTVAPRDNKEAPVRFGANVGKEYAGKKIFPPAGPVESEIALTGSVSEASVVIEDQPSSATTVETTFAIDEPKIDEPKETWRSKRKKTTEPSDAASE